MLTIVMIEFCELFVHYEQVPFFMITVLIRDLGINFRTRIIVASCGHFINYDISCASATEHSSTPFPPLLCPSAAGLIIS